MATRRSGGSSSGERSGNVAERATGVVTRIVGAKGFGFIKDGRGLEYFFHRSACQSSPFEDLTEGTAVTFVAGDGQKGPRAEQVELR